MSASPFPLSRELQEALEAGVLSLKEAWLLQDQFLLTEAVEVEMPEELSEEAIKFLLWQAPPENDLPL